MPNDLQIGKRIFLTGIILLAGASPLISCGITEWQKQQDAVQFAVPHFKQAHSPEMNGAIAEARK